MSLSFSVVKALPKNVQYRWRVVNVTLDGAYTTAVGGYPITAANMKLNNIAAVIPIGNLDGYTAEWNRAGSRLKMFKVGSAGPAVECATNESGLNGKVITLLVVGT